jgi:hypothetical protein
MALFPLFRNADPRETTSYSRHPLSAIGSRSVAMDRPSSKPDAGRCNTSADPRLKHAPETLVQRPQADNRSRCPYAKILFHCTVSAMLLSKEYIGYLGREITKKLISGEFIETADAQAATERVHAALLDEMGVEDRINDEVRLILETYSDEMRRTGANYQEMFKKVKNELVRKYKAVL